MLSGQKERRKMVRRTAYCEVKVMAVTYLLSGQKVRRKIVRRTAYCEVNVMAGTTCWLPVRYGLCTIDLRRHHAISLSDISIVKKLKLIIIMFYTTFVTITDHKWSNTDPRKSFLAYCWCFYYNKLH